VLDCEPWEEPPEELPERLGELVEAGEREPPELEPLDADE